MLRPVPHPTSTARLHGGKSWRRITVVRCFSCSSHGYCKWISLSLYCSLSLPLLLSLSLSLSLYCSLSLTLSLSLSFFLCLAVSVSLCLFPSLSFSVSLSVSLSFSRFLSLTLCPLSLSLSLYLILPLTVSLCHVEELALPMRAIQLLGEVLSTDEATSAELRKAEAAHRTRSLRRLFKAAPTTPCVCRELHSLRQVCVINV